MKVFLDGERLASNGLFHIVLIATFVFVSGSCCAADEFSRYIADMQMLERLQARDPVVAIRYADATSGVLLHSVLQSEHAIAMLEAYTDRQMNGEIVANLPGMLLPLISRYDRAFVAAPTRYEAEYLDSIEDAAAMQLFAKKALQEAERKLSAPDANGVDKSSAGRVASTLAMMRSLENLTASGNTLLVASIRQKLARKMLSQDGAKRALHVADSLEGPPAIKQKRIAPPAG